MADISKVTLPNNETYDLKDSVARGGIGNAKLFYGTCSSAAAATEKAVTCSEFTANDLVAGTMINVSFSATNSAAIANLQLNVNGTGAKNIKYIYNGTLKNIPAASYLTAGQMYTFYYDGTYWVVQLMYNTDSNTTTIQDVYVGYNYGISGVNGYKQLSILMNDEQGLPTSLTTTNGTGTKTKATNGFQLGEMYYYNGSANVNAGKAGSNIYKYVSYDVDARYSFNCDSTLVAGKSLYLVGSIGDNGLFYLDDTWWTMSLPTSEDGKVYVLVGNVVSTTKVHLIPFHPCYVYKNGGVQLYSPNYITDNYVPTTRKVNNKELSADVTLTASDVGLGNVGNFKAVSTVASQGLTDTEKSNARANIGAGTSSLAIGTTSSTAAAGNHAHGNITNAGALQTTDVAIANGDKLVVTDSSNSSKIARTSVSFDGSTTTKALTPKGTWETFLQSHQSLAGYVPTSRTINNKALTSDITLTASDVGALPADNILTVDKGGTGLSSLTSGNYIKANSNLSFGQLTPAQVLADIGAAASGHTHTTTIASGGTSQINLAANTAYTLTSGGTSYVFKTPADSNTKNTAGSTDTSSEIYLVGATSQAANPQTYSHDTARVRANGRIVGSGYEFAVASAMGTTKATMVYDSTLEAIAFQFD